MVVVGLPRVPADERRPLRIYQLRRAQLLQERFGLRAGQSRPHVRLLTSVVPLGHVHDDVRRLALAVGDHGGLPFVRIFLVRILLVDHLLPGGDRRGGRSPFPVEQPERHHEDAADQQERHPAADDAQQHRPGQKHPRLGDRRHDGAFSSRRAGRSGHGRWLVRHAGKHRGCRWRRRDLAGRHRIPAAWPH